MTKCVTMRLLYQQYRYNADALCTVVVGPMRAWCWQPAVFTQRTCCRSRLPHLLRGCCIVRIW